MRNLKIGILGTRGIPNRYGGFEQFAEHLSAELVQRGHDVSVYNSSLHPYKLKEWNGVRILHCKDWEQKIGTAGQFLYDLNCINDARKKNFDILLHFGYTSDSVWYRRWPKKTMNIINMDGLEWKRTKFSKLTQKFLKWAEGLAAKNADYLIADSRAIQEHILKTYGRNPVYIPYGAEVFSQPDHRILEKYQLIPHHYALAISRMEPENNIEMIIQGYLKSSPQCPLFIIGNITNNYGKYITAKYDNYMIRFSDAIYDKNELDHLRYYCSTYLHGHSVGGTNPSLLEAMACGCRIIAHDNQFNRAVLQDEADYFQNIDNLSYSINTIPTASILDRRKNINLEKIRTTYNPQRIVDAYISLMYKACGIQKIVVTPAVAKAV